MIQSAVGKYWHAQERVNTKESLLPPYPHLKVGLLSHGQPDQTIYKIRGMYVIHIQHYKVINSPINMTEFTIASALL